MARSNHIFNSFIAGEASPKFFGRVETNQYNQALEETKNVVIYPQGGFGRRCGTIFRKRIYKSDGVTNPEQVRLIPFSASDGTRWQLIFTDEVCTTVTPPAIPPPDTIDPNECAWKAINVDTGEVVALAHFSHLLISDPHFIQYYDLGVKEINLNELQYSQSGDTLIVTHGKMRSMRIVYDPTKVFAGSTFYFTPHPVVYGAAAASGGTGAAPIYYKEMPMLPIGDVLSEGGFTCEVDADITDSPDGGGNNLQLTFTFSTSGVILDPTWLGRQMRFSRSANTLVVEIYKIVSATVAYGRYIAGAMAADPTTFTSAEIERGYWDDKHGWPKTATFFDARLVFGGSDYFPDNLWFSQINDTRDFSVRKLEQDATFADPVLATDQFSANLKSNLLNQIRWLVAGKTIQAGTNSAEFIAQGPDQTQAIGPANFTSSPEMQYGSALIQGIRYGSTTLFVTRDRKTMREMVFNFNEDQFNADDVSFIIGHILDRSAEARVDEPDTERQPVSNIVAMASLQCPTNQVWSLDNNGMLYCFTRERRQEVAAWTYSEIAGETLITDEDAENVAFKPFVQSISSIQRPLLDSDGTGGEPDELWMAVARGITEDSVTYVKGIFIESMAREWDRPRIDRDWDFDNFIAPVYMDCTVMWDSVTQGSTGVITGLPHGENAVVHVIMNGINCGTYTVNSDGQIDISARLTAAQIAGTDSWQALIGFNFLAYAIPVPPEVPANTGTSQGQTRRIDQIVLHFYRSIGCKFGKKTSEYEANTPSLEEVNMPSKLGADAGAAPGMYTGDKKLNFPQGYERRPQAMIQSHLPYPMAVTYAVARMTVYEG